MKEIFESILESSNINKEFFFEEIFEKKPFLFHYEPFSSLVSLSDFDRTLWENENRFRTDLRVNLNGIPTSVPPVMTGKDLYRWAIDQYREGKTLILNGIEKTDVEWATIARSFDTVFGGLSSVNAFLTPAMNQGFKPHFDSHDVFIIQLAGSKKWGLFDRELENPMPLEIYLIDNSYERIPSQELLLRPGDILYIPKGWIHSGKAQEEFSLHYTLGIRPIKQIDVLHELIDAIAIEHPLLKSSFYYKLQFGLSEEVLNLLKMHLDSLYFHTIAESKAKMKFVTSLRPIPNRSLELNPDTVAFSEAVFSVNNCASTSIFEKKNTFLLFFPGIGITGVENLQPGSISFPYSAYGYVKWIIQQEERFQLHEGPDYLNSDSKATILKTLLRNGLISVN